MSEITELNHQALAGAIRQFRASQPGPMNVLLLSPSLDDVAFVRAEFRDARLFVAGRETWDLNRPFPASAGLDVVMASNVFHYSPDPALWLANVLPMTRYLILQDLIFRRRSPAANGLCDDGDAVRYELRSRGIHSDFTGAYDLSGLDAQIEIFAEFAGGRNEYHRPPDAAPRHYCAVIRSATAVSNPRPPLSGKNYLRYRLPALVRLFELAFKPPKN